jgi:maltose alpha-D-glucosyltransferase / alpha-amylase
VPIPCTPPFPKISTLSPLTGAWFGAASLRSIAVANVARTPQAVELDLAELAGRVPVELSGGSLFPPIGQLTYLLTLPPYGFYWFVLAPESSAPAWHIPAPEPMPEFITIVFRDSLAKAIQAAGPELEQEVLSVYLAKRRWFSAKDQSIRKTSIRTLARLPGGDREMLLAEVEATTGDGPSSWLLPLSVVWENEPSAALPAQLALTRVRSGPRVGLLTDAFSLPGFAHAMLKAIEAGQTIETPDGVIRFEGVSRNEEALRDIGDAEVSWLTAEQSNSSVVVGDKAVLKLFRRIAPGQHPEAEMSRYLTENGFANSPPLLGEVVYVTHKGDRFSLAVAQGFVRNQGDAWSWMLDHFTRSIDHLATRQASNYKTVAAAIGKRLGEMHVRLAQPSADAAFDPRGAEDEDIAAWVEGAASVLLSAIEAVADRESWDNQASETQARHLASQPNRVLPLMQRLAASGKGSSLFRIHGDFHLGQVLVSEADAYIIDFEGEPARPLAERRNKMSPLRDVAGLLRSLDYAAAATLASENVAAAPVCVEAREDSVRQLRDGARSAFLDAYYAAAETLSGVHCSPMLDFFLIEKAAYEVTYEAANRPSWLPIPVGGLSEILNRVSTSSRQSS